ncbi:MAG TPA: hypothetical protein VN947_32780 [Polyangia bacterium]|nr:hypothetical protein [Polyangia bacterium]
MSSTNDYQLALRIPGELLAAIDAEVDRVKQERPGARVQRSDIVREALMRAFFNHPRPVSGPVRRERTSAEMDADRDEHDPADTQ